VHHRDETLSPACDGDAPLPAHALLADMRLAPDGLLALSAAGHATLVQFTPAPAPAPLAIEWEAPLVEASAAAAASAPPAAAPPAAATTAAQGDTEAAPPAAVAPFPTARVREHIQSYTPKVAEGAPEYMAAVLQYVTAEVLQRAGDAARGGVTGTITPHHIRQAVRADENLRPARVSAPFSRSPLAKTFQSLSACPSSPSSRRRMPSTSCRTA